MQRARSIPEAGFNRRRHRSFVQSKDGGPMLDLDTPEGLKARHKIAERDIEDLKRSWREQEEASNKVVGVIDAGDSTVVVGYSKGYYITADSKFEEVTGTLEAAGTTDTVVAIIVNGFTEGTLTIPAGSTSETLELNVDVSAGDVWQVQQITAGSGAVGPTYFGVFD